MMVLVWVWVEILLGLCRSKNFLKYVIMCQPLMKTKCLPSYCIVLSIGIMEKVENAIDIPPCLPLQPHPSVMVFDYWYQEQDRCAIFDNLLALEKMDRCRL